MKFEHEVIFCVVNAGFSEAVMDAAKEFGARGGTVIAETEFLLSNGQSVESGTPLVYLA